jgi:hypothetical protein
MPDSSTKEAASPFRLRKRLSWGIFAAGLALLPVSWLFWIDRVGVSWWDAYRHGSDVGSSADRLRHGYLFASLLVCLAAPFFGTGSVRRRFLFSVLAVVAALAVYYVCGFVWLLLYGA